MATRAQLEKFEKDGYVVMEDFLSLKMCERLRAECADLVMSMKPEEHSPTVFDTKKKTHTNDYFLNSGDKIRYFFETGALDDKGKLKVERHRSLNKIGHALHLLAPGFKEVTFDQRIQKIAEDLGYQKPLVPQSMYIFKQPGIGGEVVPHQDATYLWCEPLKVMGFWLALEDATLENGCLHFIPGSHKSGLYGNWRFGRNYEDEGGLLKYTGESYTYDDSAFKPVPVKAGSLVLIDGLVAHKSERNTSEKSRHIYTFHIYEGNSEWDKLNWLQPTDNMPFPELFTR